MPNSNSELTAPQKIIQTRLRYLSFSIILSSVFIVLWGVFAKLPTNSYGLAFILPAFDVESIASRIDGHSKLLSTDQSSKISKILAEVEELDINQRTVKLFAERTSGNDNLKTLRPEVFEKAMLYLVKVEELIATLSSYNATPRNNRKTTKITSLMNEKNNHNEKDTLKNEANPCFLSNRPIYYISNNDDTTNLKTHLDKAMSAYLKITTSFKNLTLLQQSEQERSSVLLKRIKTANDLFSKQVISQSKLLSIQDDYLNSKKLVNSLGVDRQHILLELISSYGLLTSSYSNFVDRSLYKNSKPLCIIERIAPDKSFVNAGSLIGIGIPQKLYKSKRAITQKNSTSRYTSNDSKNESSFSTIPFFYLANQDKGIMVGNSAIVYPRNVPRNTFGGITGKVIAAKRVVADKSAINWIVGFRHIKPYNQNSSLDTIYYGLITLDHANTATGFHWTSGNGPDFPLLLGTESDVQVRVSSTAPISYIIPFFRTLTGQAQ